MDQTKDAIINVRLPKALKEQIASLSNVAGVTVSEMGRILWERMIWANADEATALAIDLAAMRFGPEMAKRRAKLETERLKMITAGVAEDDGDGGMIPITGAALDAAIARMAGQHADPSEEPDAVTEKVAARA